ncbi:hypothetical protein SLS53_008243 [Cytospora paraplurivora]|uniref:Uncharacterized protein n=1 Tax=Cytospora paraplurivora TaxID=2898453 RepID=A0AAN9U6E7_9PEZI
MVKHQRKNHLRVAGICVPVDDGTSESGGDDMPSTPRGLQTHWGQHPHGQIMMPSDMGMQRSMSAYVPHVPYDLGRQSLSSNGQDYHNGMHHEQAMLPRRISAAHIPQPYYMDANNPGVATMGANHFQHVQRQQSNAFSEPGMTGSLNSSPSDFSSSSLRSPIGNDGFGNYALHPAQAATHALNSAGQPHVAMGQFQQQCTTQPMMPNQSMMAMSMQQHSQNQNSQSPVIQGVYSIPSIPSPAPDTTQSIYRQGLQSYQDPISAGQVTPYQEPVSAGQVPYDWGVTEVKYEDTAGQGFDLPSDRIDQID